MKKLLFQLNCLLLILAIISCGESNNKSNSVNASDGAESIESIPKDETKSTIFQESDGIVVFEAENVPLSKGWTLENKHQGYSGKGYITWTDSTMVEKNNQGLLAYKFKITKPGSYTLKLLNFHDCEDFTECNDVYVKMNNGEFQKNFNHNVNSWDWTSQQDINHVFSDSQFSLSEGIHTLYLSGRSQYFSIDRIALYHEEVEDGAFQKSENSKNLKSVN